MAAPTTTPNMPTPTAVPWTPDMAGQVPVQPVMNPAALPTAIPSPMPVHAQPAPAQMQPQAPQTAYQNAPQQPYQPTPQPAPQAAPQGQPTGPQAYQPQPRQVAQPTPQPIVQNRPAQHNPRQGQTQPQHPQPFQQQPQAYGTPQAQAPAQALPYSQQAQQASHQGQLHAARANVQMPPILTPPPLEDAPVSKPKSLFARFLKKKSDAVETTAEHVTAQVAQGIPPLAATVLPTEPKASGSLFDKNFLVGALAGLVLGLVIIPMVLSRFTGGNETQSRAQASAQSQAVASLDQDTAQVVNQESFLDAALESETP